MKKIKQALQKRIDEMCATGALFRVDVTGDKLWSEYIAGFANAPVFRDPYSSVHNCNSCKAFVNSYGNVVAIDENFNVMSMWDECNDEEYAESFKRMAKAVHNAKVCDVFLETVESLRTRNFTIDRVEYDQERYQLGIDHNIKRYIEAEANQYPAAGIKPDQVIEFTHLSCTIPAKFVKKLLREQTIEGYMSKFRSDAQVFFRGLNEISLDTMLLVKDMIEQDVLINAAQYMHFVTGAIECKKEFDALPKDKRNAFVWANILREKYSHIAVFRNTLIGTFMVEVEGGAELDSAILKYNKNADPVNYKRAKSFVSQRQIDEAQKFVEENGYTEAFNRRCATIDDIKVSDILHSNISAAVPKTKLSIFDNIKATKPTKQKNNFKNVEEIPIDKFMSEILPTCSSVEAYLQSRLANNFVNLLVSEDKDVKRIFNWNNNFSFTFAGNLAGKSNIATEVEKKGGCIEAFLRCSIIWNERGEAMDTDFDNHCYEYNHKGTLTDHIYYSNHREDRARNGALNHKPSLFGGWLDVDITSPMQQCAGGPGVENIYYKKPADGRYDFKLHNYRDGTGNQGGRAEIVVGDETFNYVIPRTVAPKEYVDLATVYIKDGALERIEHGQYFVEDNTQEIYGLNTSCFHKVNLVCLSPNYWQDPGIGNKHYFFMLEGAKNPNPIRSIHNEFLNKDMAKHRKVMEVLGNTLHVESTPNQLCGLGFNATVRDSVFLRINNGQQKVIKVNF